MSLLDPDDIDWLLTLVEAQEGEIDVLTFKVSNLTTERDVANQEIERLTRIIDALSAKEQDHEQEIERLTQELGIEKSGNEVLRDLQSEKLRAKVEKLRDALIYCERNTLLDRPRIYETIMTALTDTEEK